MVGALKDEGHLIFLGVTEMVSCLSVLCWCFVGGGTPVLIPNTAVKPSRADGTRKGRVGRRQHRVLNQGDRPVPKWYGAVSVVQFPHVLGITEADELSLRRDPFLLRSHRHTRRHLAL